MSRLSTERALAPLVAQFVPLKVSTESPAWSDWARRYQAEGSAIPKIYVVRADGQQLYGSSGSMDTPALGRLMLQALNSAGRVFTNEELAVLTETVAEAKKAMEADDPFTAVVKLKTLKRFGEPGDLKSFAQPAVEADELVKQLTQEGQAALDQAREQLEEKPQDFAAALAFTEADRIYSQLPSLERAFGEISRSLERTLGDSETFRQAETISRARGYARAARGGDKRAIETLNRLIAQHPDTPAAEAAAKEIRDLGGEVESPPAGEPVLRTWTDSTGQFRIEATLVKAHTDAVTLQKTDGRTIVVPLSRLSAADQAHVRQAASGEK